jgi:hypothetical protein
MGRSVGIDTPSQPRFPNVEDPAHALPPAAPLRDEEHFAGAFAGVLLFDASGSLEVRGTPAIE